MIDLVKIMVSISGGDAVHQLPKFNYVFHMVVFELHCPGKILGN